MTTTYQAGDSVVYYASPFWQAQAEHAGDAPDSASRPATIVREIPDEPDVYELTFSDGAEPPSALASGASLLSVAAYEAAKAARAARATAAAAELVAEAQRVAAERQS
jgi:hypothetical protein